MLLDGILPEHDVSKRYAISIDAPAARVYEELLRYRPGSSFVTRLLMTLRGYGPRMRVEPAVAGSRLLSDTLERFGFTLLTEEPGEEIAFGLAGKFWRLDGGLVRLPAPEFASFAEPGYVKVAWNLRVTPSGPHSELSTETRVQCFGEEARRKFLRYWRVVEPFSGLIRKSLLRAVRRAVLSSPATPSS